MRLSKVLKPGTDTDTDRPAFSACWSAAMLPIFCGYVRTTQDLDLLVMPNPDNARRIIDALAEFGFGGAGIPMELFERDKGAVHLGVEPNRVDILTSLKGVDNREIFKRSWLVEIEGISVNIISLEDLLQVKRNSDRPRDVADADELAKINISTDPQ